MARCEMASFQLTVLLALFLSLTFVSTLSDEHRQKLDEIEKLLRRLQNEIDHMRGTDRARQTTQRISERNSTDGDVTDGNSNANKADTYSFETTDARTSDNTQYLTTLFEDQTTQRGKTDSDTRVPASTAKLFDSTTISSDLSKSERDLSTEPSQTTHPESFHSTGPSTTEKKKDNDGDKKDAEEKDKEENDLLEVENVRRLIDEGEDLERQLKGVFSQLRSLSQCTQLGEKCGLHKTAKCCRGLKCSADWSGTCHLDCIPYGNSCSENFFCCSGSQCVKSVNGNGDDVYTCQ